MKERNTYYQIKEIMYSKNAFNIKSYSKIAIINNYIVTEN